MSLRRPLVGVVTVDTAAVQVLLLFRIVVVEPQEGANPRRSHVDDAVRVADLPQVLPEQLPALFPRGVRRRHIRRIRIDQRVERVLVHRRRFHVALLQLGAVLQLVVLGPFLFQRVLQHLDATHQIVLQILLALPFALEERDAGLQSIAT